MSKRGYTDDDDDDEDAQVAAAIAASLTTSHTTNNNVLQPQHSIFAPFYHLTQCIYVTNLMTMPHQRYLVCDLSRFVPIGRPRQPIVWLFYQRLMLIEVNKVSTFEQFPRWTMWSGVFRVQTPGLHTGSGQPCPIRRKLDGGYRFLVTFQSPFQSIVWSFRSRI